MGDESRYRYRRDDAAAGSGSGSRPAQAAGDDPLAELARLMDHDPFDDFDGLPQGQQARQPAPPSGAVPQQDARRAAAQRFAPPPPAPAAPVQRAPVQAGRPALQPPPRAVLAPQDYDADDDAQEDWDAPPARQPALPVRAAPTYAPAPQARAPQPRTQRGQAQPAPVYAPPAPRAADPRSEVRTTDVRTGYGSLARDPAARPAQQPPAPAYDAYDDEYDDDLVEPQQPRHVDPRARSGYGQSPALQAYARHDERETLRYADSRQATARGGRYQDDTDEAGYAYSSALRDEDYDYDDYDDRYDPEYADDGYMPPHGEDLYEPEPRRRRGRTALVLGVSLLGLVVAGAAGVFAYNMAVGPAGVTGSGAPPVIKADSAPAKTQTPVQASADPQKMIYDRVGGAGSPGNERMVPREEQPVDVTAAARAPADGGASAAQPMQTTQNLTEPKRVRTMTVRADGSVTPGVPSSAVSAYAPSQNPIPVGLPQPNPVTTVPAAAPADATASTSPAPTAAGTYVVQVASQRSESDALGSWKALQAKYPNLLGTYKATVKKADLGDKGIYYRAQVGPFASRDQANDLCQSLRAQGGDCVVTRN